MQLGSTGIGQLMTTVLLGTKHPSLSVGPVLWITHSIESIFCNLNPLHLEGIYSLCCCSLFCLNRTQTLAASCSLFVPGVFFHIFRVSNVSEGRRASSDDAFNSPANSCPPRQTNFTSIIMNQHFHPVPGQKYIYLHICTHRTEYNMYKCPALAMKMLKQSDL